MPFPPLRLKSWGQRVEHRRTSCIGRQLSRWWGEKQISAVDKWGPSCWDPLRACGPHLKMSCLLIPSCKRRRLSSGTGFLSLIPPTQRGRPPGQPGYGYGPETLGSEADSTCRPHEVHRWLLRKTPGSNGYHSSVHAFIQLLNYSQQCLLFKKISTSRHSIHTSIAWI